MVGTHEFHLSIREIHALRFREMIDMLNYLSVYQGAAKWKKKILTYDQIMQLR